MKRRLNSTNVQQSWATRMELGHIKTNLPKRSRCSNSRFQQLQQQKLMLQFLGTVLQNVH